MKKKILALLCLVMVWALPSALQAKEYKPSVTLYGNLRYSIGFQDMTGLEDDEGWTAEDNASRFGIKASHGNEYGKVFIHLQTGSPSVDGGDAFTTRFFFGGLECEYGKLSFGRMSNAYKMPGVKIDPFYDTQTISSTGGFGKSGATYGLSPATNSFQNNTVQYVTPNFNGFKFVGSIAFDDGKPLENDMAWLAGGSYSKDGLTVGAVYADSPETQGIWAKFDPDSEAVRAYASYKGDGWKGGVSYENVNNGDDVNYFYVTGTAMMKKTDVSLSVGLVDGGSAEGMGITGGVAHHLLDNAKIYAQASWADLDMMDHAPYVFSVGMVYNFKYTAM